VEWEGRDDAVGMVATLLRARECSPQLRENDVLSRFTVPCLRSEGSRIERAINYSKFPAYSECIL
jgi:hypothetical protein